MKKLIVRTILFFSIYAISFVVGTELTTNRWEEKLKLELAERYEIEKIKIDVENTIATKEANDHFLRTLWNTCINAGGFVINNEETGETEIFKCERAGDDNEFTVARR